MPTDPAIEIFRAGEHKDMNGTVLNVTVEELQRCADAYNPNKHEAPLVIGHPKTDAPAYGWVESLRVDGNKLVAYAKDMTSEFVDWVRAGKYKKISAAFWPADHDGNPTPGILSLKHVGFLGAAAPAVKGLKPVTFSHADAGTLIFGGSAIDFAVHEALEKERRKHVNERLVTKALEEGRLLPCHESAVLAFMDRLSDDGSIEFAEPNGNATSEGQLSWFRSFVSQLPKVVHFGEYDMGEQGENSATHSIDVPAGYRIDQSRNDLVERAEKLARDSRISFAEALRQLAR